MNFDEVFKKIEAGTATEEEKEFFNAELDKLRLIKSILDEPLQSPVIAEADTETVLKARKQFNRKTTLKIILLSVISLIVIAIITCSIIFIPSLTSASRSQKLGMEEALTLAYDYLSDYLGEDTSKFILHDCDRELRIPESLNEAIYVYEVELRTPEGDLQYEMDVSTKTGFVELTDIDKR